MRETKLGIRFPYQSTDSELFVLNTKTQDQIKSDIQVLIIHALGDRYMMPYYGLSLAKYIFEPIDDKTTSDIINDVKVAIQKFIFGVQVRNVDVILEEGSVCVGLNVEYVITDGFVQEQDFVEIIF